MELKQSNLSKADGWKVKSVICTTMSLDPSAMIQTIFQVAYPNSKNIDSKKLEMALHGESRIYFFHDKKNRINYENDANVIGVLSDSQINSLNNMSFCVNHKAPIFHPKIILVEFENERKETLFRVQIASKNLTSAYVFEVAVQLESRPNSTPNHNLDKFVDFLAEHSSCDGESKDLDRLKSIAKALSSVKFVTEENEDCYIKISGCHDGFGTQDSLIQVLEDEKNEKKIRILSPSYETKQDKLDKYLVYAPKEYETHAKLYYLPGDGERGRLWLGSSNLSDGGLRDNIECMVGIENASGVKIINDEEIQVFETECERITVAESFDGVNASEIELNRFVEEHVFSLENEILEINSLSSKTAYKGEFSFCFYDKKTEDRWMTFDGNQNNISISLKDWLGQSHYILLKCKVSDETKDFEGKRLVSIKKPEAITKENKESRENAVKSLCDIPWFRFGCKKDREMYEFGISLGQSLLETDISVPLKNEVRKVLSFMQFYYGKEITYRIDTEGAKKEDLKHFHPKDVNMEDDSVSGKYLFQSDAIAAACEAFQKKRYRFLVADEAGLGKTHIAKGIIEKRKKEAKASKKPFIVYYFGSNVYLLHNTLEKLKGNNENIEIIEKMEVGNRSKKFYNIDRMSKLGACFRQKEEKFTDKDKIYIMGFSSQLIDGTKSKGEAEEIKLYNLCFQENNRNDWVDKENVLGYRQKFNQLAVNEFTPDIVILDEFHRYFDKLEEIASYFDNKKIPLLLLSATPYVVRKDDWKEGHYLEKTRIQQILEDADEKKREKEQKQFSFKDLLLFLLKDKRKYDDYVSLWDEPEKDVSEFLKQYMWRNERQNISEKYLNLPSPEDFLNKTYDACTEYAFDCKGKAPRRYFDLCSGVWSFGITGWGSVEGDDTVSKVNLYEELKEMILNESELKDTDFLFTSKGQMDETRIKECLRTNLLKQYAVDQGKGLLWIPPTYPFYGFNGSFQGKEGYSKLLVFSGYELVPRLVATMCSKLSVDENQHTEQVLEAVRKLRELDMQITNMNSIAQLWSPKKEGKTAEEIMDTLCKNETVKELASRLKWSNELLSLYILSSPYICSYRVTGSEEYSKEICEAFYSYFCQEPITKVLEEVGVQTKEDLLRYCLNGNIQALLYEYAFCCRDTDKKFTKRICTILNYTGASLNVVVPDANNRTKIEIINCRFADRFSADSADNGTSGTSKSGETHKNNVEKAFNSPFWPMVLSTTSVGQEGIDMDAYCHRIMHYSIPATPMSFEQRDGRVDRMRSLLARRKMTEKWGDKVSEAIDDFAAFWQTVFAQEKGLRGMAPEWVQLENESQRKQERILPFFPYSDEEILFRRLQECKDIYRSQLGNPNEESIYKGSKNVKLNNL